jgi:nucleoside-diphosphate-sugar epimerase
MNVLLTGAFGNVGVQVLSELIKQGHSVTCFDVQTKANCRKQKNLGQALPFDALWGDLCQAKVVQAAVTRVRPEAIVHLAAIIPPFAYLDPERAYDVNVNGTYHLLAAAQSLNPAPTFVYTSSYSVHGPRNPHRDLPRLAGATPVAPSDNYGRHKAAGEKAVQASGLSWTILRLCGILPIDLGPMRNPAMARYLFLLPPEQRQQGIDARDAGLAIANAVTADVENCILEIGGGEDWQWRAGDFFEAMFGAMGFGPLPRSAFRRCDPAVDESWYYEDWVDADESEALLQYQRHSRVSYLDTLKRQMGLQHLVARLLAPVIRRLLVNQSPYYGQPNRPDARTHWEIVCDLYGLNSD